MSTLLKMKISFFIPDTYKLPFVGYNYNKMSASSWIRCLQLIPYFKKEGIAVSVNKEMPGVDCAIFLRRWSDIDYLLAEKLQKTGVKIFLDTPVNYFSDADHSAFTKTTRHLFRKFANLADGIICASENIANYARKLEYNALCIEDAVDMEKIVRNQQKNADLIWAGTAEKAEILNFLLPIINANNWKLTVITEKRPNLNGDFNFEKLPANHTKGRSKKHYNTLSSTERLNPLRGIEWNYSTFFTELSKGKVGIFPRNCDNDYDRGHSFYKIGIFLASHVPVIYSPVPEYAKIANAANSIRINNLAPKEWEHQIKQVLSKRWTPDFTNNPIEEYTCQAIAEKYKKILL